MISLQAGGREQRPSARSERHVSVARKLGGGMLVALGVVMILTPGPGIPLIVTGLTLWGNDGD